MLHIKSLDGIRGFAVLIVVFTHFDGLFGFRNGSLGVDIFFVLSGFLITRLLLSEIDDTGSVDFGRFYVRRALRLMPAAIITVLVFGIIDLVFEIFPRESTIKSMVAVLLQYPSNWVRGFDLWQLHEFSHTWSLAVEEQFYLVWPITLLALTRLVHARVALMALIMAIALALQINRYLAIPDVTRLWLTSVTHMRADAILIGCVAAMALAYLTSPRARRALTIAAYPAAASIVAVIVAERDYFAWQQPVICVATALLILDFSVNERGPLQSAASAPWLAYTGRISYGLYLYHYPIYYLTVHAFSPPGLSADIRQLICLLLLFPASYLMAWASFKYVEGPALRLRSRFHPAAARAAPQFGASSI